nr:branched-chain amino acid ABC transporter permease [Bacillota bacterium]
MTLTLIAILMALVAIYFAVDLIWFRKSEIRGKLRFRLVNVLMAVGFILSLYVVIKQMTLMIFLQIFLLNSVDLCVLILATAGIVLIFKTSVTANFAQGMIGTFGAYVAAKIFMTYSVSQNMSLIMVLSLSVLAGVVFSFLIGLFVDAVMIRNAKRVTAVGKQMITMGLAMIISTALPIIFGKGVEMKLQAFSYEVIIIPVGTDVLVLPTHNLISIIITVVVLSILFLALKLTKWGLGVRATASNEVVASMMGVNTRMITAFSWAIAGGLIGLAACLLGSQGSQLSVVYMVHVQVNSFLAPVLGGFFSFGG